MSETRAFDCWAIVEIMGHVTMAGRVTEQAIGGQSFIRVDVPAVGKQQAFTRFYGPGAIYSITPVDEETGRLAVANLRQEPITVYGLPRQLPAPTQLTLNLDDLVADEPDNSICPACGETAVLDDRDGMYYCRCGEEWEAEPDMSDVP